MERFIVFALIVFMVGMFAASAVVLAKGPHERPFTPVIRSVKGAFYALEKDPGSCIASWVNVQNDSD